MLAVAVAVPFGVAQLVLSVLSHVTLGGVLVAVTTAWHVLVQPVAVFVTVTVYVLADKPDMLDVVAPVLHKYVGLAASVLTLAAPFGVAQFVFGVGVQFALMVAPTVTITQLLVSEHAPVVQLPPFTVAMTLK